MNRRRHPTLKNACGGQKLGEVHDLPVWRGKGHKRSIVALGHKMLRTIYTMLSKNTHYVEKTVDYEAQMVARNAPRWLQMLTKHGFVPTPA